MTIRLVLSLILLMAAAGTGRAQWKSAHANSANTGFTVVNTIPAAHPVGYADVGPIADGANPVIGTDDTVYIGNTRGELIALFPDGTQFWKRQLDPMFGGIYTSPVIGSDGSIYVVSRALVHDSNNYKHLYSYLHKFSPASAWLNWVRFPLQNALFADWVSGGGASGPPNLWHFDGAEVIIVPIWYPVFENWELRLIAFSTNLGMLAVQPVTTVLSGDISNDFEICDYLPCPIGYSEPNIPFGELSTPGVAIWQNPAGPPWIWVADNKRATVAYQFALATGFSEIYRFSDNHDRLSSTPTALDVDAIVAAVGTGDGRLKFEHTDVYIPGLEPVDVAAPTLLPDGRLVVVTHGPDNGVMYVVSGAGPTFDTHNTRVTFQAPLNGPSIASAAASCTHLFVASQNELVTYDLKTMSPIARVPWTDGGYYAPVIGPSGYVYGMTRFGLFVFPPPSTRPITSCQQVQSGGTLPF